MNMAMRFEQGNRNFTQIIRFYLCLSAVAVVLTLLVAVPVMGQQAPSSVLTLDRLFGSSDFSGDRFGPAR